VVEASRFFEPENHSALADPRTRLIVGDGRSHLMLSRSQYDVIVSEPSNPWMAGIASLFTREFFASARARLSPGGVLCQWAHTYDISDDDLRSIVATFLSVFPDGTLWLVGEGDVLLVGSTEPLDGRLADVERHWRRPSVASDLIDIGVREPFALLSAFVASGPALAAYAAGAAIQTDNRVGLEFSGPRNIFGPQVDDNAEVLRGIQAGATPPAAIQAALAGAGAASWRNRGTMMLQASAFEQAWRDFRRALELDPTDAESFEGITRASVAAGRVPETMTFVRGLGADPARVQARLALSRLLASQGAMDEAGGLAFDLVQRYPGNLRAWEQLASVLADAGDIERLQPVVARLRNDAPTSAVTRYYTAVLLYMQGRPDLAVSEAEAVVRNNPRHARAQNLLGAALASLGERDRARDAFLASLGADPRDPSTYTNLATLEMQGGNRRAAAQRFAEALTLDPSADDARRGLAEALRR
jgi:Flp pilus assembly protein TadD